MVNRRNFARLLPAGLLATSLHAMPGLAMAAQQYPSRPVRLVVAFPAGGGADIIARLVAAPLQSRLGQPFIVDNRAGAGGIIGTDAVAKSAGDGYTLLFGQTGPNAINTSLYAKLPYDAVKDLTPIIQTTVYPYVVVVSPKLGVTTLDGLIALVRSRPGELSYGSAGNGSSTQLAAELLLNALNLKMIHVPYRGTAPALADVSGEQVAMMCGDVTSVASLVQGGRLTALAVTSPNRSALFPNVPTVAEAAVPGFEAAAWHGLFAPARTPENIVASLHDAVFEVLQAPDLRSRLGHFGIEAVGSTPAQFGVFIKAEIAKWQAVVNRTGLKL